MRRNRDFHSRRELTLLWKKNTHVRIGRMEGKGVGERGRGGEGLQGELRTGARELGGM